MDKKENCILQNKVVILNSSLDNNFKAVLTLSGYGKNNIKFFNLSDKYKSLALGFRQSNKVIKVPLDVNGQASNFDMQDLDTTKSFTCAVVDVSNAFCPEIILSASQNGKTENENIENAFVKKSAENPAPLYEDDSQEEIENLIDENLEQDDTTTYFDACANCKYRQAFYDEGDKICDGHICSEPNLEQENISENIIEVKSQEKALEGDKIMGLNEELSSQVDDNFDDGASFYEQIKPQLDALFAKYERDERLENILPNSTWVRVTYDSEGGYYVLGLIREDEEVKYISYGMPSKDDANPPDDLSSLAQYLKLGDNDGYWIVCQDAQSGKTMKVKIIE